jgi:hypothetical protein
VRINEAKFEDVGVKLSFIKYYFIIIIIIFIIIIIIFVFLKKKFNFKIYTLYIFKKKKNCLFLNLFLIITNERGNNNIK